MSGRASSHFVIGSRDSELAMIQARHVRALLCAAHPDNTFEISAHSTSGDRELDSPLAVLAAREPGLFTKDLEKGLATQAFDLVVHSLKDMPTTLPPGLVIASITEREPVEDVLLVAPRHKGVGGFENLPKGAVVGTSSVRRAALLRRAHPHLVQRDVRGNLQTRLRKLDADGGEYDALLLAHAGLKRLGWDERVEAVLDAASWPYGPGQGALGIECRAGDARTLAVVKACTHAPTWERCTAERAFMRGLLGGCQVPIAVNSETRGDGTLFVSGTVLALDGQTSVSGEVEGAAAEAEQLGAALANDLKVRGASAILGRLGADGAARATTYSDAATDGAAEAVAK